MYNFDKVIDRTNSWSVKWDKEALGKLFGNEDVLPLWVADMDFKVAPGIIKAMQEVIDHGIFGYSDTDEANEALCNWMSRRHDWQMDPRWVVNTPGIVFALNVAVQTFTQPGDSVLIQRPVYYPFTDAVENNGRRVVSNSFVSDGSDYQIDFEDFETKISDPNVSLMILCSPHNPLGKVFTKEELQRMLDLAFEHQVTVVVDEIHGDLIMPGTDYHTVGNLGEDYANRVITCLSPSKSFNIAGVQWSGIVIPDEVMRHKFLKALGRLGYGAYNALSFAAVVGAYNDSEEWLDAVIDYIYDNYLYLKERFESALPDVQVLDLEATYLAFVDFNSLGIESEALEELFVHQAKVGLDAGEWFGPEGKGLMRFNLACPRETLTLALDRIIDAIETR